MEDYINYWLKKTVKETPNDAELGAKIRNLCWEKESKKEKHNQWLVEQYNRNRNPEDWVESVDDINILERNPDTGEIKKRKIN